MELPISGHAQNADTCASKAQSAISIQAANGLLLNPSQLIGSIKDGKKLKRRKKIMTEIEQLRAALKPFASIKEIDDDRFDDNQPVMPALNASWVWHEPDCQLTLGDFRR